MDDSELEQLLCDLESDRVERKASVSDGDKIRQAICAFANDLPSHQNPGVVFIGANDDGTCAHLPITDQLLLIHFLRLRKKSICPAMAGLCFIFRHCDVL